VVSLVRSPPRPCGVSSNVILSSVAHAIYGIPTTINTSNYTYFIALEEVHNMGNAEAVKVFVDELLNLHRGQGWDIMWRDSNSCPTLEQYRQMVIDSTRYSLHQAGFFSIQNLSF